MGEIEKHNLPKLSLFDAAVALSDICHEIDNHPTGDFEDVLIKNLYNASSSLTESIDRRKHVYREAESKIELAKAYKNELDKTIKKLERVQESIELTTKNLVNSFPDVSFKDSLGKKITVQKNTKASLHMDFEACKKTVNYVLCENEIQAFDIPKHMIKTVTYIVLDTDALRSDLESLGDQATKHYSWASLVTGSHVRGLR